MMGDDGRLRALKRLAAEEKLWRKGDRVVVAVSGGPDSMALLHMLSRLRAEEGIALVAAHANHGFRAESEEEAVMVRDYAAQLGVPFEHAALHMPDYIEETGMNSQEASRTKRYAFLHEAAQKHGAGIIALAHHADDQAETVMMRLLRGTGTTGLAAIAMRRSEKNVELIRPLLRMRKSELLQYCADFHIPYCIDSSNEKRDYFRNVVRLDVLPYLSRLNPGFTGSLCRLAHIAGAEDDWMEHEAEKIFRETVAVTPSGAELDAESLAGLHVALQRRLIKLILNYLSQDADSVSFEQIESMRAAARTGAKSTWKLDAGGNIRFLREYGKLRFVRLDEARPIPAEGSYPYEVHGAGSVTVNEFASIFTFTVLPAEANRMPEGRHEACFDMSKLTFPLKIRNRQPGDRMNILGLNGSKKVQDMFVDAKVAPSLRERYPILCDAEGRLLWVPGIRRSGHALAQAGQTESILHVRMEHE
ncbi:tRNA lysidine(34) synthetase TilS [Paenibacillus protaetiae]|uniref:tRNA(Ile)-lysidine synthase n=1 Tax=Paenibacillus protaetiae TaxID=2509456 RepID=A0A4P6EVV5_9BACL|nr:tRNA lysidine(34) synthetase TilS [Paenibacillus protaetiae]QAY67430.1 tRNA lysidine(34) synthetase TilS [Paenibacillus protaetiae]